MKRTPIASRSKKQIMTKEYEAVRGRMRYGISLLIDGCYNARNPSYPELIIFQPMKLLNEIVPYIEQFKAGNYTLKELVELAESIKYGDDIFAIVASYYEDKGK